VLAAALRQCRAWQDEGFRLPVAVNLSPQNLLDPALPETIARLLAESGVAAGSLKIEITETTLMADPDRALDVLRRLHALGVQIAIDDFGTGYSSLAYLKRLPVAELKIDRSFVQQMAVDENDRAIVRSTIGLGHDLGLGVVAEGVEDRTTWELLAHFGCDTAQGYYLSRPLTGPDLTRWLKAWSEQGNR
jgi:EAL domain-containing protein (putative c-di-GMP-specific phosphodiesterase class I)